MKQPSSQTTDNRKRTTRRLILFTPLGLLALCLLAAGIIAFDNSRLPAQSEIVDRLSPLDKARLAEADHLRQSVGGEILPGWESAEILWVVYNEEYAFLVGSPTGTGAPPEGWVTVPRGEQRGGPWERVPEDDFFGQPYYRQRLPASGVTPQAFTVMIGDRWAASLSTLDWTRIGLRQQMQQEMPPFLGPLIPYRLVVGLLVDSSDQYITLILHEAAHAYQGTAARARLEAGETASYRGEDLYPWEDEDLQAAWQAELDLLKAAMHAKNGEEVLSLARQFLDVRRARREAAGLSVELVDYERHREWVEGIARYAEISSYRLAASPAYSPLEEMNTDGGFHGYSQYAGRWSREVDQITRMAGDRGDGRFYYSGLAQAVLLDRLAPGWQGRLFEEGVWLEDLLAAALE